MIDINLDGVSDQDKNSDDFGARLINAIIMQNQTDK